MLFGPPPPFTGASACPGLDRQASGLPLVTPRDHTWRLVVLRALAFASPPFFQVRLATKENSPARFSTRTVQPRKAAPSRSHLVSGSFDSLSRVLFSFRSRYYYAIGLGKYLGLDVIVTHIRTPVSKRATL